MEFSTYVIWDVILNAVGYLAAGALSVVLYQIIRSRRQEERTIKTADVVDDAAGGPQSEAVDGFSFVSLKSEPEEAKRTLTYRKRDRGEVLRQARDLLRIGESNESIRKALPVSEAELALLRYEMK